MRLMRFAAKEVPSSHAGRSQTVGKMQSRREMESRRAGEQDELMGRDIVSFVLRKIKIKLLMAITHLR